MNIKKILKYIKRKIDILMLEDIAANLHEAGFYKVGVDYENLTLTGMNEIKK